MTTDPSLEQRKQLAQDGRLLSETVDGTWVATDGSFVCPEVCGSVFASEEAYRDYCPADCGVKTNSLMTRMRLAAETPVFDVFCLYREDGRCLKVVRDIGSDSPWWWRNVSAVAVQHFASEKLAQEAVGRLRSILKPVFDVDPHATDDPRPLTERVPEPLSGPHEYIMTFRVSDELEARIVAQADAEGLGKGEWLRRLAELHT